MSQARLIQDIGNSMIAFIFLFFLCSYCSAQDQIDTITIMQADAVIQPMKMFVGVLGDDRKSAACQETIAYFKHCCEWSGRFELTIEWLKKVPKKKRSVQQLFDQEYDCAVFITYNGPDHDVEWRLYDTAQGEMLQGKKIFAPVQVSVDTKVQARLDQARLVMACRLAAQILQELTAEPQPFMSKIVYRKKAGKLAGGSCSLVVTDFDGKNSQTVLQSRQRILVSPRWTSDAEHPLLVFSEFTPNNVRLKMCDLLGRSAVVFDAEGTTVGVSYAPNSKDVIYCRSGDIWGYQYDVQHKKAVHSRIVYDGKTCSHPTLLANGDIIYCSQGSIKRYDAVTKKQQALTAAGYCVAPAYSAVSNKIVYAKRLNGQMQLCVYDLQAQKHEQLTTVSSKPGDKDYRSDKTDPFWAPDGVHVVFCWERNEKSRIAILDTVTKEYQFITPENEHCSYPAWSGNFSSL